MNQRKYSLYHKAYTLGILILNSNHESQYKLKQNVNTKQVSNKNKVKICLKIFKHFDIVKLF